MKRLNDAMLGVYQACSRCKGARISGLNATMPLSEAVDGLLEEDLEDAYFVRQRALVRLVRAKVHLRHPYGETAVKRLAGSLFDRGEEIAEEIVTALKRAQDQEHAKGPDGDKPLFDVVRDAYFKYKVKNNMPVGTPDWHCGIPTTFVCYSPADLTSTVTGFVDVRADPKAFEPMINPLQWRDNNPDQFEASYAADVDRWDGDPRRVPKVEGSPNGDYVLFEQVGFRLNGATESRFRNLLRIKWTSSSEEIRADYDLYQSLTSQLGLFERLGGLDVDTGFFAARRLDSSGLTRIKIEKTVRYTDATPYDPVGAWDYGQTMNYLAPSLVGMWIEAVLTAICQSVWASHREHVLGQAPS